MANGLFFLIILRKQLLPIKCYLRFLGNSISSIRSAVFVIATVLIKSYNLAEKNKNA